jgi:hypothetical protein
MVGNSSITRRPPTDSDRETTSTVRFARNPGVLEVALCLPGAQQTLARIAMNLALLPQLRTSLAV